MQKIYSDIKAMGADVLVVSFAPPALIAAFLAESPQPFPVVADPERKTYQAFGIGSTNLRGFLRLGVIWHYLKLMFRGWFPKGPKGADVWQLGGDFVIDPTGRLRYAHASKDAADRPGNEELLSALRLPPEQDALSGKSA
ncbi:MAG: redoxin domain-containing protein [Planctomycetes bacterium]|nr:redoxin domain-containing protein [Planctomycetota bacterium]